jgi:hypothetical protein
MQIQIFDSIWSRLRTEQILPCETITSSFRAGEPNCQEEEQKESHVRLKE